MIDTHAIPSQPISTLSRPPAFTLTDPEKRVFRRRIRPKVSEYAEAHRVITRGSRKGPWINDTTPYAVLPMDMFCRPWVRKIQMRWAPQSAKTQVALNCLMWSIDHYADSAFYVMADEKTARRIVRRQILPAFKATAPIAELMGARRSDTTALFIQFSNGVDLTMAWATSAAALASESYEVGFFDETAKYPKEAGGEADPVYLGEIRTTAYPDTKKLMYFSSPDKENDALMRIESEADVKYIYKARCPACGALQEMRFRQFTWPKDATWRVISRKRLARYQCAECPIDWDDATRNRAVQLGRRHGEDGWHPDAAVERPAVVAFHLPGWYSPFVSLSDCVADYLEGKEKPEKKKTFITQRKAKPFRAYEKTRQENQILRLCDERPRGRVPGACRVAALTATVDTQDYGFWYEIRAWGWGTASLLKPSWCVRAGYVETWLALESRILSDAYYDVDGNQYVVMLVIQDGGGHRTAEVYDQCRKHPGKWFVSFGKDTMQQPYTWGNIDYYPGGKKPIPGGLKILNLNSKYFKDELARLLSVDPADPGAWRYYADFPEAYAAHLTAEFVNAKGMWECPSHKENHLWDCAYMNLAAHEILGIKHWPAPDAAAAPAPAPEQLVVARSAFVAGH